MKTLFNTGFIILFSLLIISCKDEDKVLQPVIVKASTIDEILPLEDSLVVPVLYPTLPNLKKLPISQSKKKFIAVVLPAILVAKYHLEKNRNKIHSLAQKEYWNTNDSTFYQTQLKKFKAKDNDELLLRMVTHPNSIALAQAAIESGWGSSRFFQQANNLFGIWSYSAKEPRIPANESDVFLRKYDDISQSIEDYFVTIGRARAYSSFRELRAKSDNVNELLPHLKNYSERGIAYTSQLRKIIDQNNFRKYDHYIIDPEYFVSQ